MIRVQAVLARFPGLTEAELADYAARGWISPADPAPAAWHLAEVEVVRIGLIRDLRRMDIADATLPVVLSLVDEVRGLRQALAGLLRGLDDQPPPVREALLRRLREGA